MLANIDDNNYRVTMNDFLVRWLQPLHSWAHSAPVRVCTCTEISDRLSRTVCRFRHSDPGLFAWITVEEPRTRRYSSGFLSVTCKSISLLDLCYETDVSLVGGGVSTSPPRTYLRIGIVAFDLYPSEEDPPPFGPCLGCGNIVLARPGISRSPWHRRTGV